MGLHSHSKPQNESFLYIQATSAPIIQGCCPQPVSPSPCWDFLICESSAQSSGAPRARGRLRVSSPVPISAETGSSSSKDHLKAKFLLNNQGLASYLKKHLLLLAQITAQSQLPKAHRVLALPILGSLLLSLSHPQPQYLVASTHSCRAHVLRGPGAQRRVLFTAVGLSLPLPSQAQEFSSVLLLLHSAVQEPPQPDSSLSMGFGCYQMFHYFGLVWKQ